ncbi:hypothetical protein [Pasteuria penetrans]|uniref:hypothetical protein n=1 Tax=Pasteuria penetrans TaxID=86005 RepID=UPI0011EC0368|nr:hypothetical protein [Pasteuria penetrans]
MIPVLLICPLLFAPLSAVLPINTTISNAAVPPLVAAGAAGGAILKNTGIMVTSWAAFQAMESNHGAVGNFLGRRFHGDHYKPNRPYIDTNGFPSFIERLAVNTPFIRDMVGPGGNSPTLGDVAKSHKLRNPNLSWEDAVRYAREHDDPNDDVEIGRVYTRDETIKMWGPFINQAMEELGYQSHRGGGKYSYNKSKDYVVLSSEMGGNGRRAVRVKLTEDGSEHALVLPNHMIKDPSMIEKYENNEKEIEEINEVVRSGGYDENYHFRLFRPYSLRLSPSIPIDDRIWERTKELVKMTPEQLEKEAVEMVASRNINLREARMYVNRVVNLRKRADRAYEERDALMKYSKDDKKKRMEEHQELIRRIEQSNEEEGNEGNRYNMYSLRSKDIRYGNGF